MQAEFSVTTVAQAIQLALSPAFLLTGIAAYMNLLSGRLGRIIDRTRTLEDLHVASPDVLIQKKDELRALTNRRRWINRAITLCTISAVLTAGVVALIFVGAILNRHLSRIIAAVFVMAMIALIAGLLCFLREVHLAVREFRLKQAAR